MSSQHCSLLFDVEEAVQESSIEPTLSLLVNKHYVDVSLQFETASHDVIELGGTITVSF